MSNRIEIVVKIDDEEWSIGRTLPDAPVLDDAIEGTLAEMRRDALRHFRKMPGVREA